MLPSPAHRTVWLSLILSGCGGSQAGLSTETDSSRVLEPHQYCSDYGQQAIATFEDPKLEASLRVDLGGPMHITCGLLARLTVLTADGHAFHPVGIVGIESLVGIQNLTALSVLDLDNNSIVDIGRVGELTALTRLNLQRNSISDISALSTLTGLTDLRLAGTLLGLGTSRPTIFQDGICEEGIASQGPARATASTEAGDTAPGENPISSLDALSGLTSVRFLTAGGASTLDITALRRLTNLECLGLAGTLTPDLHPMSGLTALQELWLQRTSLTDIQALRDLSDLTTLKLEGNLIIDLEPLSGLTKLRELGLSSNSIVDVQVLSELTNLKVLGLADNQLTDIQVLSGLTNLDWLDLRGNSLADIEALNDNDGLGAGDIVFLDSCAGTSILTARGVTVLTDGPSGLATCV